MSQRSRGKPSTVQVHELDPETVTYPTYAAARAHWQLVYNDPDQGPETAREMCIVKIGRHQFYVISQFAALSIGMWPFLRRIATVRDESPDPNSALDRPGFPELMIPNLIYPRFVFALHQPHVVKFQQNHHYRLAALATVSLQDLSGIPIPDIFRMNLVWDFWTVEANLIMTLNPTDSARHFMVSLVHMRRHQRHWMKRFFKIDDLSITRFKWPIQILTDQIHSIHTEDDEGSILVSDVAQPQFSVQIHQFIHRHLDRNMRNQGIPSGVFVHPFEFPSTDIDYHVTAEHSFFAHESRLLSWPIGPNPTLVGYTDMRSCRTTGGQNYQVWMSRSVYEQLESDSGQRPDEDEAQWRERLHLGRIQRPQRLEMVHTGSIFTTVGDEDDPEVWYLDPAGLGHAIHNLPYVYDQIQRSAPSSLFGAWNHFDYRPVPNFAASRDSESASDDNTSPDDAAQ